METRERLGQDMDGNLEQSGLRSELLLEIIRIQTEIVRQGLDLGGVMNLVTQRVQQLITNSTGAVVELAEGEDMVYRAVSGVAESSLGLRLNRRTSLSGLCVQTGEALRCEDTDTDDRVDREACRRIGLRSMVVVPLHHGDEVVGVLKALADAPGAFQETDAGLLELMSEVIGAAMFHAGRLESNELFRRATHDELTGLPNRAFFFDRLRHRLAQARRKGERFGILNLDMDGLKPINDNHGHRAGDAAIHELGSRVKSTVRNADTVARVGGDEFAVILFHLKQPADVDVAIERIENRFREPFQFEAKELPLGASIGPAVYPDDGEDIDSLVENADRAMYRSKRNRKSR